MAHNLYVPNYGGPRYRCQGMISRPRRGETTTTPTSYAVGDTARLSLVTPDGNPDAPWITEHRPFTSAETFETRLTFPFSSIVPENIRSTGGAWDYPLNVQNLDAQIVATSTGAGTTDPRGAGLDLMARIWSVKTWSLTGDLAGPSISESWAAGNRYAATRGDTDSSSETVMGEEVGRAFVPTEVQYTYSVFDEAGSTQVFLNLLLTSASRVSDTWANVSNYVGAGLSGGVPVICPRLTGQLTYTIRDDESEVLSRGIYEITPARLDATDYTLVEAPLTVCGYTVRAYLQNSTAVSTPTGSIVLNQSELWGPDAWP